MAKPIRTPASVPEVLSEPSVRAYHDWTPDLLRGAEILAEGGNLTLAADACDALVSDEAVSGALSQRIRALDGCEIEFVPGRGRRKGRAVHALEADEDWDDMFPSTEYAQLRTWGLLLGVGLARLPWRKKDATGRSSDRIVAPIEVWHPRNLSYDGLRRLWTVRDAAGRDLPVIPGEGEWLLYTPYGRNRPWNYGLWRGLMRWWLLKNFAIQDWGISSGVHTVRAVTSEKGGAADPNIRKRISDELKEMGRNGNVVLPPGFAIQLLETSAKSYESYKAQIEAADTGTSFGIVGQNMTSKGDGATFASAKVGESVRQDLVKSDADAESSLVHEQVLCPWALFNFGDPSVAPWPARVTEPPEDLKSSGDAMLSLGNGIAAVNAALAPEGLTVDVAALVKKHNIPVKAASDAAQKAAESAAAGDKPAAPPPAGGGPPKGGGKAP